MISSTFTKFSKKALVATLGLVVVSTMIFAASPASAVTNGQSASNAIATPNTSTTSTSATTTLTDSSGLGINANVITTITSHLATGYTDNYGWVAMQNAGCGIGYEAVDANCNKLPLGWVSGHGTTEGSMWYLPYWNFMWWGGNGSAADLSQAHQTDMTNNCDDNSYLHSGPSGQWKRRWANAGEDQGHIEKFGSWGTQNDSYYNGNVNAFNASNDPSVWNGNRDHTNLGSEQVGWWSGCVRYNSYRYQVVSQTPYTYVSYYTVSYSVNTSAPCGSANIYNNAYNTNTPPTLQTLTASVSGTTFSNLLLQYNDGQSVNITNPTSCQFSAGKPAAPTAYVTVPTNLNTQNILQNSGAITLNSIGFPSAPYTITNYFWKDNGAQFSTSQNTTWSPSTNGTHNICVYAQDSLGQTSSDVTTSQFSNCRTLVVYPHTAPLNSSITATTPQYAGDTVQFAYNLTWQDGITGSANPYAWVFKNTSTGITFATSALSSPTISAPSYPYTACFTATDAWGYLSTSNPSSVNCQNFSPASLPTASFSPPASSVIGQPATFVSSSAPGTYPITNSTWTFKVNNQTFQTTSGSSATITVPASGTYQACLVVTDSNGRTSANCQTITTALPTASPTITANTLTPLTGVVDTFTIFNSATPANWTPYSYQWVSSASTINNAPTNLATFSPSYSVPTASVYLVITYRPTGATDGSISITGTSNTINLATINTYRPT